MDSLVFSPVPLPCVVGPGARTPEPFLGLKANWSPCAMPSAGPGLPTLFFLFFHNVWLSPTHLDLFSSWLYLFLVRGWGAVMQEREEITYMDYLPFKLEVGIAIF